MPRNIAIYLVVAFIVLLVALAWYAAFLPQ